MLRWVALLGVIVVGACGPCTGPLGSPKLVIERAGEWVERRELELGETPAGRPIAARFGVENTGAGPLELKGIQRLSGAPVALAEAPMRNTAFELPVVIGSVQPGERLVLDARFLAPRAAPEASELELLFDRSTVPDAGFTLVARGTERACVAPQWVDFGVVATGAELVRELVLSNPLDGPVTMSVGPLPFGTPFFQLDRTAPLEVAPNGMTRVRYSFRPPGEGVHRAQVLVQTSAECEPVLVRLEGVGASSTVAFAQQSVDFGFTRLDAGSRLELTVENIAFEPVTIRDGQVFDGQENLFSVSPRVLTVPGAIRDLRTQQLTPGTATVTVGFQPREIGPRQALLTFRGPSSSVEVELLGFGGGPGIGLSTLFDLGRTTVASPVGFVRRGAITVTNVGTNTAPPRLDANLRLEGSRWTIQAANVATSADELCLGGLDRERCTGDLRLTGYDPARGLEPGESLSIPIFLRLRNANTGPSGTKTWVVTFETNDAERPMAQTTVAVRPLSIPPCNLVVTGAAPLSFGNVSEPRPTARSLRLCNGAPTSRLDQCLIDSVSLGTGWFSFAGRPPTERVLLVDALLEPGECVAPRLETLATGPVPATEAHTFGIASVTANGASRVVQLRSAQGPACLMVDPAPLDFGEVSLGCRSVERRITLFNGCAEPVAPVAPLFDDDAQGAFTMVRALPSSLIPVGGSADMLVRFQPRAAGATTGALLFRSVTPFRWEKLVELRGLGAGSRTRQVARLGFPEKADVILSVDGQLLSTAARLELRQHLDAFLDVARGAGIDARIAVTQPAASSSCLNCRSGRFVGISLVRFAEPSRAGSTAFLGALLDETAGRGKQGLAAASLATASDLLLAQGANTGVLRPEASLGVVSIGPVVAPASGIDLARLRRVKGADQPQALSAAVLLHDGGTCTAPTDAFVTAFGGVQLETCSQAWPDALREVGRVAFGFQDRVWLRATPFAATSLTVRSDAGVVAPTGWRYDPATNTVRVLEVPDAGLEVEVEYPLQCLN